MVGENTLYKIRRNLMSEKKYYGGEKHNRISFLEFGSIDVTNAKKDVWGFWIDQNAYDLYMFSRYARDLFEFRDYLNNKNFSIPLLCKCISNTAHDKINDYLAKYIGAITISQHKNSAKSIVEIGSSLMAIIDELLSVDYTINGGKCVDFFNTAQYIGCDISELMNKGAKELHENFEVITFSQPTAREFIDNCSFPIGLFYGLSVSLRYSLRSSLDLIAIGQKSELSVFNRLSFSLSETIVSDSGTGKNIYIVSLDEYVSLLKQNGLNCIFTPTGIQLNKDGNNTIRATIVMSKKETLIEEYIQNYQKNEKLFVDNLSEWYDISDLKMFYK